MTVPLLTAAKNLLALMDSVPIDPSLGMETDRVFSHFEFEELREAVAVEEGRQRDAVPTV